MYPTFFHWHTKHVLIQNFFLMISRLRIAWFLMVCMTVYKYARIVLVTFIFARCSHAIRSNKKISHLKALFICIDCIIYVLGRFNKTKGMRGFFSWHLMNDLLYHTFCRFSSSLYSRSWTSISMKSNDVILEFDVFINQKTATNWVFYCGRHYIHNYMPTAF